MVMEEEEEEEENNKKKEQTCPSQGCARLLLLGIRSVEFNRGIKRRYTAMTFLCT